jgi:hypothetical protein
MEDNMSSSSSDSEDDENYFDYNDQKMSKDVNFDHSRNAVEDTS